MKKLYTTILALILLNTNSWAVTYTLIDPNATTQATAMYATITGYIASNKTAIGQQNESTDEPTYRNPDWYGVSNSYPMFAEWEFYQDGSKMPVMYSDAMKMQYNNGGIIGVNWGMNNWATGGNLNDLTGNTAVNILPGGANRATYLIALQNFANWCRYTMAGYPILFRPYQENDGTFFWWGSSATSDAHFILLWQDLVTTLESMGVHNLIYVYAPEIVNGYTYTGTRYPGDSYVDVFGIDRYFNQVDSGSIANDITAYDSTNTAAVAHTKPYAITEGYYDFSLNYAANNWTNYMSTVQADSAANKAVYIMFFNSRGYNGVATSFGPIIGRGDSANFISMLNTYTNLLTIAPYKAGYNLILGNSTSVKGHVTFK